MQFAATPRLARELFEEFKGRERLERGEFISFGGVGDKDVYNITAPFTINGRTYIAGRVESRQEQGKSEVRFFEERNGFWRAVSAPIFQLEDPFVTKIGEEIIFGGVETFSYPDAHNSSYLGYRTVFYRGHSIQSLQIFACGPDFMKDIRLIQLKSKEIAVFTRPQEPWIKGAGRGKIAFIKIPNLEALKPELLLEAKIIEGQFQDQEWGGANELHLLKGERIGVLGHIAYMDSENKKHYYAMAFTFDTSKNKPSPLRIIASRENFPEGPSKRSPELDDILFPGGLLRQPNGITTLYCGLSDARAGRINIPDPFEDGEKSESYNN
jgi:hypothetical protein